MPLNAAAAGTWHGVRQAVTHLEPNHSARVELSLPLNPPPSPPLCGPPPCSTFSCNLEAVEAWQPCSRQAVGTLVEGLATLE